MDFVIGGADLGFGDGWFLTVGGDTIELTGGTVTGVTTLTTSGAISNGTIALTGGAVTGVTTLTASGVITGGTLADGTASLNAGALAGAYGLQQSLYTGEKRRWIDCV